MSRPRKERLGRGLGALLGEYMQDESSPKGEHRTLAMDSIAPNPFQPRREFRDDELNELMTSMEMNGLLQPPLVRPVAGQPGSYQLVAGERRFRSASRLGWKEIPVVVRDVDDQTLLVLALVENIQREDLGALDEAEGYRVLADDFGLTQEEIAQAVGKSRSTITNLLRLLRLPAAIRRHLQEGALSMGHARALLSLESDGTATEFARRAVKEGWSVRQMEERVRKAGDASPVDPVSVPIVPAPDPNASAGAALEEALQEHLGTRVRLKRDAQGAGRLVIPFQGDRELERLFAVITGRDAESLLS